MTARGDFYYDTQQVFNDFESFTERGLDSAVAVELTKACAMDRLASAVEGVEHVIGLVCNEGGRGGPEGALVRAIRDASVRIACGREEA
jgi:hypothetical protein